MKAVGYQHTLAINHPSALLDADFVVDHIHSLIDQIGELDLGNSM